MKKLLATLTTVAMLATTTAFAAPIENNAGYNKTAGTYSVKSDLSEQTGQLTLLIIPESAYSDGNIEDSDILYIDQGAYATGLFQSVGILGGKELKAGTYYAKIGGTNLANDGIVVESFTIVEESQGEEVQMGDVNDDTVVNGLDLDPIVQHILKTETLTGKAFFVADLVVDSTVNGLDLDPIVQHILKTTTLGKGTYIAE